MPQICIIDYKTGGNVFSLQNSLKSLGIQSYLSSNPLEISKASQIIFPGVGSYSKAIEEIKKLDLINVIQDKAISQTPFMGVCVGMQVLFEYGHEGGLIDGLKIIPGTVSKFPEQQKFKIPHIGWNQVYEGNLELFKGIANGENFYFVHSYRVGFEESTKITNKFSDIQLGRTSYIEDFINSLGSSQHKLYACQFHPEKSGEAGLKILENFAKL